jgi:hypothetical protein
MAVGNTGEYLDFAADAMCTWLSRDGGATWEDVADHAVRSYPLHSSKRLMPTGYQSCHGLVGNYHEGGRFAHSLGKSML